MQGIGPDVAIDIAFWAFGMAAVVFGWRVFRTDSMVRASFALLASFLNVGAIMVLLLAEYLGVALLFMMALEMVVMALFMVAFMMNPGGLKPMRMVHQHRSAVIVGVLGAAGLLAVALAGTLPARPLSAAGVAPEPADIDVSGSIESLGHELLGGSMLIFESAGVALLATMIGAVILSARSSRFGAGSDADEGSRPPPIDPDVPSAVPDVAASEGHQGHGEHQGHGNGHPHGGDS